MALGAAISACERQIAFALRAAEFFRREYPTCSLPAHYGFTQLAIIRDKQGDWLEAIRLSRIALEQGWDGNWEDRIVRCEKKMKKKPAVNKGAKGEGL